MAKSVNKFIGIGRLGRDPELKHTQSGTAYCRFSMAFDDSYTTKDGTRKDNVTWLDIVCWGKLAEITSTYLSKGSMAYVEGPIEVRKTDDGRVFTSIRANDVMFLGGKGEARSEQPGPITDDDIPF